MRPCETKEDLEKFFDVSNNLKLIQYGEELKDFGCEKINCVEDKWMAQELLGQAIKDDKNDNSYGVIEILMISSKVCLLTLESLLERFLGSLVCVQ